MKKILFIELYPKYLFLIFYYNQKYRYLKKNNPNLQEKENPNDRKPLKEIVMEVRTNG